MIECWTDTTGRVDRLRCLTRQLRSSYATHLCDAFSKVAAKRTSNGVGRSGFREKDWYLKLLSRTSNQHGDVVSCGRTSKIT